MGQPKKGELMWVIRFVGLVVENVFLFHGLLVRSFSQGEDKTSITDTEIEVDSGIEESQV